MDSQHSSERQRQLMQDRLRTRAISMFLACHRENILEGVNLPARADRNERRRALQHEARVRFRRLSEEEQQAWMEKVNSKKPKPAEGAKNSPGDHASARGSSARGSLGQDVPAKRARATQAAEAETCKLEEDGACGAGVGECMGVREFAGVRRRMSGKSTGVQERSGVPERAPAASHPMTPPRPQRPHTPSLALALEHSGAKDKRHRSVDASQAQLLPEYASMRQRLGKAAPTLAQLYGDAGAAEVIAATFRILDAILPQLRMQKQSDAVKVAVVAGLAAKLTQTPADPTHVKKLWAAFAGRSNKASVAKLEPHVLNMWAAQSLDSEYWPRALRASTSEASPQ